jgi:cytosine/adenosine deaminase-related metal-dependent hydrolase
MAAVTQRGALAASASQPGKIEAGAPADLLRLDFGAMSRDLAPDLFHPLEILQARGTRDHVLDLIVGGRQVVKNGAVTGVDEAQITAALHEALLKAAPAMRADRGILARYQNALERYYSGGCHCHR